LGQPCGADEGEKTMKFRHFLAGSVAGLAMMTSAALTSAMAQTTVKIGMITTLSGPGGYLGQDVRDGFKLAMEDNKLGGVPVELLVEDDGLKPGQGKQIAEKFMKTDGVKILTGIIFSNVAGATVPDVVDGGGLYVSPNAGPSNFAGKECHKNYFVVSWQNDTLHEAAGENTTNLGFKKAFILAPNYPAGKDALAGFKRRFKGEVVGEIYTRLDQTDFAAEMAQIRAANPDVVFQFQPGGLGIAFLRQYAQAGLQGKIPMSVSSPSLDAVILNAVGEAADGLHVAGHWNWDLDNAANKKFKEAWTKAYNRPASHYASQGYDTGLAIASALKATGGKVDVDALRNALRKAEFQSVRGNFKFAANQHPVQDWYSLKVEKSADGKLGIVTKGTVLKDYADSYVNECKM
jgi:branched-chain amino acid transport system substrate-binding protein